MPVALSYEYDPCDFLKAQEMQLKRDVEGFKKSQADDLMNMQTGIFGYKGHVHFQTSTCINDELEALRGQPKTELFARVSELIEQSIYIWAIVCIRVIMWLAICCKAHRLMLLDYTAEDKVRFEQYLQKKMAMIQIPNKDEEFLRKCMLTMYANPVINQQKAKGL